MPCGMSSRIDGLISQLKKTNERVEVITPFFYEYKSGLVNHETAKVTTLNLRWLRSHKILPDFISKLIGNTIFSLFAFLIISARCLEESSRGGVIVQYQDFFSAPPAILAKFFFRATVIGDDVRLYFRNQRNRTAYFEKGYEIFILRNTDYVLTSFKDDYTLIKAIRGGKPSLFFPNGIRKLPRSNVPRNPNSIVFVAQFANPENVEALFDVIYISDKIAERLPEIKIYVVGGPIEAVHKVVQKSQLKTKNLQFLGRISQARLASLYQEAGLGILPYFDCYTHSSQRIKVLEYLSNGLLVVSSSCAVDGFENLTNGSHYILAKTRDEMVTLLSEVVENYPRYFSIAAAGKDLIDRDYTWDATALPYIELVKSLVND
jgi:glycosyltransferase involved in cell wall biosynthesis